MKLRSWALVWIGVSALVWAGPTDDDALSRVTGNLMCTCGCPHIIDQCGEECGLAPQLKHEIAGLLDDGNTEQEIYDQFEAKFGPVALAVPDAEGFNLLAWVFPFVGLALGLVLVVVVAKNLKPAEGAAAKRAGSAEIDKKYRKMLEKELEL